MDWHWQCTARNSDGLCTKCDINIRRINHSDGFVTEVLLRRLSVGLKNELNASIYDIIKTGTRRKLWRKLYTHLPCRYHRLASASEQHIGERARRRALREALARSATVAFERNVGPWLPGGKCLVEMPNKMLHPHMHPRAELHTCTSRRPPKMLPLAVSDVCCPVA